MAGSSFPFGATKNDENAFSRAQQKTAFAVPTTAQQSFTIHVDPEPVIAQSAAFITNSTVQQLNPALTSLSRPALTNVFVGNGAGEGELTERVKFFFNMAFRTCNLRLLRFTNLVRIAFLSSHVSSKHC